MLGHPEIAAGRHAARTAGAGCGIASADGAASRSAASRTTASRAAGSARTTASRAAGSSRTTAPSGARHRGGAIVAGDEAREHGDRGQRAERHRHWGLYAGGPGLATLAASGVFSSASRFAFSLRWSLAIRT